MVVVEDRLCNEMIICHLVLIVLSIVNNNNIHVWRKSWTTSCKNTIVHYLYIRSSFDSSTNYGQSAAEAT